MASNLSVCRGSREGVSRCYIWQYVRQYVSRNRCCVTCVIEIAISVSVDPWCGRVGVVTVSIVVLSGVSVVTVSVVVLSGIVEVPVPVRVKAFIE